MQDELEGTEDDQLPLDEDGTRDDPIDLSGDSARQPLLSTTCRLAVLTSCDGAGITNNNQSAIVISVVRRPD
jgi:hypothetical protein